MKRITNLLLDESFINFLKGMPALLLLMKENATVTVCHSRTKNIDEVVRRADIVIAAIGVPQFVCVISSRSFFMIIHDHYFIHFQHIIEFKYMTLT